MRTASTLSVLTVGLATAAVLGFGTSVSAAPDFSGNANSSAKYVLVDGHRVVTGTTIGEWGKTGDGKRYSFTYKAGEAKPIASAAPATARCSVYISDVSFHGAGAGAWFQWETSQVCSGSFGSQKLQTQMWRSSWSGLAATTTGTVRA